MIALIIIIIAIFIIAIAFSESGDKVERKTYKWEEEDYTHYTVTETGSIYIIRNELFPEYMKIGMTTRDPEDRIREFNTAVPINFTISFESEMENPYEVERDLHNLFSPYRVGRKEWFKVDVDKSKELMLTLPYFKPLDEDVSDSNPSGMGHSSS